MFFFFLAAAQTVEFAKENNFPEPIEAYIIMVMIFIWFLGVTKINPRAWSYRCIKMERCIENLLK